MYNVHVQVTSQCNRFRQSTIVTSQNWSSATNSATKYKDMYNIIMYKNHLLGREYKAAESCIETTHYHEVHTVLYNETHVVPSDNFDMTLPNKWRLRLMFVPSLNCLPLAPVALTRSDPARSTRLWTHGRGGGGALISYMWCMSCTS